MYIGLYGSNFACWDCGRVCGLVWRAMEGETAVAELTMVTEAQSNLFSVPDNRTLWFVSYPSSKLANLDGREQTLSGSLHLSHSPQRSRTRVPSSRGTYAVVPLTALEGHGGGPFSSATDTIGIAIEELFSGGPSAKHFVLDNLLQSPNGDVGGAVGEARPREE